MPGRGYQEPRRMRRRGAVRPGGRRPSSVGAYPPTSTRRTISRYSLLAPDAGLEGHRRHALRGPGPLGAGRRAGELPPPDDVDVDPAGRVGVPGLHADREPARDVRVVEGLEHAVGVAHQVDVVGARAAPAVHVGCRAGRLRSHGNARDGPADPQRRDPHVVATGVGRRAPGRRSGALCAAAGLLACAVRRRGPLCAAAEPAVDDEVVRPAPRSGIVARAGGDAAGAVMVPAAGTTTGMADSLSAAEARPTAASTAAPGATVTTVAGSTAPNPDLTCPAGEASGSAWVPSGSTLVRAAAATTVTDSRASRSARAVEMARRRRVVSSMPGGSARTRTASTTRRSPGTWVAGQGPGGVWCGPVRNGAVPGWDPAAADGPPWPAGTAATRWDASGRREDAVARRLASPPPAAPTVRRPALAAS